MAVSQGPTAVAVALGLLTTKVRHQVHHLAVVRLMTKFPRLGVVRLGRGLAVAVDLLCLGLVVVVVALLCLGLVAAVVLLGLGLVVAVASCPFRVRLGVPVVALGLAACRRRRGDLRVGT